MHTSSSDGPGASREVSVLLQSIGAGDRQAADRLLPLVYDELRRLADSYLVRERPGQTLQATALVHEAFVRLVGDGDGSDLAWDSRGHFFGAAAHAMRRILVDRHRGRNSAKRGGGRARVDLDVAGEVATLGAGSVRESEGTDFVKLDAALERLAAVDQRKADVVMLRYFAGLNHEQVSLALGISSATVRREWAFARAWLIREMRQQEPDT